MNSVLGIEGGALNSSKLCAMPCISGQTIEVPAPGSARPADFRFCVDRDRALFFAMIGNTQRTRPPSRKCRVAIVGLSPADTQLRRFVELYNRNGSYEHAALEAAFEGLERDLIRMMNGLGVASKLGLDRLPENLDLNNAGCFLTTSLIKCASLTVDGGSSDFDPWKYESNTRCVTERFVPEMLEYQEIKHLLILGSKAQNALTKYMRMHGVSVHDYLSQRGKTISYIPHPSGANRESVELAALPREDFPTLEQYQERMWATYRSKRLSEGKRIGSEASYKATRASRWKSIAEIRRVFDD